jgi:type II secretory pathway pseudopilin PulG
MLVVITIIGILAGMITAAAIVARRSAKNAAIVMEVKQLEMACQAYKEKFGEYPPDFAFTGAASLAPSNPVRLAAQDAVIRHLARVFPRCTITNWGALKTTVQTNWNIDVDQLSPSSALIFWLGGRPEWLLNGSNVEIPPGAIGFDSTKPFKGFRGFSADPQNPFSNSASRIKPFFEFDVARCSVDVNGTNLTRISYWPQGAVGDKTSGALVYFRAENNVYTVVPTGGGNPEIKRYIDNRATPVDPLVYPAGDSKLTPAAPTVNQIVWIEPKKFQIWSAGLDVLYSAPTAVNSLYFYQFPSGDNYNQNTYDDITNFSGGTLESKMD